MIKFKVILILLAGFILLESCGVSKVKSSSGGKAYYEEYYIDAGVLQYFIKPLDYKVEKYKASLDYIFRDTITNSNIDFKYSFFSDDPVTNIDSAKFVRAGKKDIKIRNHNKMFVDRKNKGYKIRHSGAISYPDLKLIFKQGDYNFHIYYSGEEVILKPTKRTLKIHHIFDTQVVEIIEMNR